MCWCAVKKLLTPVIMQLIFCSVLQLTMFVFQMTAVQPVTSYCFLVFVRHISLPWVSFGMVPELAHGGGGLGSLSCVQEDVWLLLEVFVDEGSSVWTSFLSFRLDDELKLTVWVLRIELALYSTERSHFEGCLRTGPSTRGAFLRMAFGVLRPKV